MLSSQLLSVGQLLAGLVLLGCGFVLPDRVRGPWGASLAFLAPVGLGWALLGVLTLCVPGFFAG